MGRLRNGRPERGHMTILSLLNRVNSRIISPPHPFKSSEMGLRKSYLLGVAMQARSDAHLDAQEEALFLEMACAFGISVDDASNILETASQTDEAAIERLQHHLLPSKHKYYFILDLQIMAHQDRQIKSVETEVIWQFSKLLQVEAEDVRFLMELADALVERDRKAKEDWVQTFFESNQLRVEAHPQDFEHYTDDSNFNH